MVAWYSFTSLYIPGNVADLWITNAQTNNFIMLLECELPFSSGCEILLGYTIPHLTRRVGIFAFVL